MSSSTVPAHVWPLGDHTLGAWPTTSWRDEAQAPENWSLAFQTPSDEEVFGEPPRVVAVTVREDGVLALDIDAQLRPGIVMVLTGDQVITTGDVSESVAGPYPRLLHTAPTVPPLLDIDAPLIPPNGIRLTASGDYALAAELVTVEKMLWAAILTPAGSLDWDPGFGGAIEMKRLRPADLVETRRRIEQLARAVPYVVSAKVQILFENDEAVIAIDAETQFGHLETTHAAR
jgi:hypothetical protein